MTTLALMPNDITTSHVACAHFVRDTQNTAYPFALTLIRVVSPIMFRPMSIQALKATLFIFRAHHITSCGQSLSLVQSSCFDSALWQLRNENARIASEQTRVEV